MSCRCGFSDSFRKMLKRRMGQCVIIMLKDCEEVRGCITKVKDDFLVLDVGKDPLAIRYDCICYVRWAEARCVCDC